MADSPEQDLEKQFFAWMDGVQQELSDLQAQQPAPLTSDWVDQLYDIAHNIKGIGGSFGYPLLSTAGASLCGYIKGKPGDIDWDIPTLNAHIKVFQVVYEQRISGDGGEQGVRLSDKLKSRVDAALARP